MDGILSSVPLSSKITGSRSSSSSPPETQQVITLVDHTKAAGENDAPESLGLQTSSTLSQKLTRDSLRQSLARRNYQRSRWQEGGGHEPTGSDDGQEEDSRWGEGRVQRGRRKVKDMVRAPKKSSEWQGQDDPNVQVDILYENQRGFFLCGIPHFSSNSLLNFDPSPWLDGQFKPSAVDITNAQVPDPNWEWSSRTWYVEMSHDVDEEGWEYSFWFKNCSWHGTRPWFHSFVRRRRWLRQRVRGTDDNEQY